VYFRESTVNDNHEEGTQAGQTWTLAYIAHLGAFISGDLNICCQNFACNTAVAGRQQHHNSQLLSQGHAVRQLAATTRKVCLSIYLYFCALLVSCLQHTCPGAAVLRFIFQEELRIKFSYLSQAKGKGKVRLITGHVGTEWGQRCSCTLYLTSALKRVWVAPWPLYPQEGPNTHCTGD
jgi:hypothetical protein